MTARVLPRGGASPRAEAFHVAILAHALAVYGDIVSQIESAIVAFFQSIWNGISGFFGGIFASIGDAFRSFFEAPIQFVQGAFQSLSSFADQYGPFAPIILIGIVGVVFVAVVLILWLIIRVSVSEAEKTGDELEEGV
jgi:hypothetical protein